MQRHARSTDPPPYAALLSDVAAGIDDLVAEVARDIAGPEEDIADVSRQARPSVAWLLDRLARGPELMPEALATLREEGGRAARSGEALQRLLDRYLSTGWVVWAAATQPVHAERAERNVLAALGRALLRAGDAAAAAIGDGFSAAERDIAARTASARREYLDEVLDLAPGDGEGAARIRRRGAQFGIEPSQDYRVVVADLGRELEDGGPELDRVTRALERPARSDARSRSVPIATTRRGGLVLLVPAARAQPEELETALDALADGAVWRAVASPVASGITAVAGAEREARQALGVAERAGRRGLLRADDVLLERALLADEALATAAVERELGPLLAAPRIGGALVRTLEVHIAGGLNVRRAARELGVAPRTVAYRLARIASLLGGRLEGERLLRIAAALELRRLLGGSSAATALAARPVRRPAARPPKAPRGRSPRRRRGATAT